MSAPAGADAPPVAEPRIVESGETLWFLGTLARMKLVGELTAWLVEPEQAADGRDPPAWVGSCGRRCGPGTVVFAPGGCPHTFRVESDTARMVALSTPAGIENMIRGLAEPAKWPWLEPPSDGPRVPADRIAAVERETGMVRHGPPPPPPT